MKLTLWTYEGPPHVGAMRVATAMEGLHYVLHAPQGDTYADLLFTMIERRSKRPPVTYTTFQARDLGGDTAELFKSAAREAYDRFRPQALLVGASCTAELIQDDPGGLARALDCRSRSLPSNCRRIRRKKTGAPPRLSISWYGHSRYAGNQAHEPVATSLGRRLWAFGIATTLRKSLHCSVALGSP